MDESYRIARIATWIAGLAAIVVTLIPPIGYFATSYQYLAGNLEAEAGITSLIITDLINANPELWRYEQLRLEELLARRTRDTQEIRRILDPQDRLIAENGKALRPPLITRSFDLMDAGIAVGRLEISRSTFPLLVRCGLVALLGLSCGVGIFIALRVLPLRAVKRAEKSLRDANRALQDEIIERKHAQEQIIRHSAELQQTNAELKALYRISAATSRTIELDKLLADVLGTLAETEIFPFEIKGSIFLLDGEWLHLASFVSLSETDVEPCRNIRCGECLCGLAAATGEMVISRDSSEDARHTLCTPNVTPHGHVVIPLKAANRTCGVLNLLTRPAVQMEEQVLQLLAAIGNQVGVAINNARLYEETKTISLHDPLTGLANRRFMELQLEKNFAAVQKHEGELSLIMIDIDHFKSYNDTHGHVAGDRLLAGIADILQQGMRSADQLFRYGGEEFLAVLPRTGPVRACEAAERLRLAVESEGTVTISLGVASYGKRVADKGCLVGLADEALYRAKEKGRNRVERAHVEPLQGAALHAN